MYHNLLNLTRAGSMNFCCAPFQSLVDNAGKRGLGIVAVAEQDLMFFCIQGRAVHASDEQDLEEILKNTPSVGFTIVSQTGLQFCPFCGAKLSRWIKKHLQEFNEIANATSDFVVQ